MSVYTMEEAKEFGRSHARNGLMLTPHDCLYFDRAVLSTIVATEKKSRAAIYAEIRGAFNEGWNQEYFRMVSSEA